MKSSTLRLTADQTSTALDDQGAHGLLADVITDEWRQSGQVDLVAALQRHPIALHNQSLLLNLAIAEYESHCRTDASLDLYQHCARFRQFGSSIELPILRTLELRRLFLDNPELLRSCCESDWPAHGDELGKFRVLETIGIGAIARVYLCLENDIGDREVVLKVTPYSSGEASILGRLSHPNITPIHSTGVIESRGLRYLCMPYFGRSTLRDVVDVGFQDGCPRFDVHIAEAARRWTLDEPHISRARQLWSKAFGPRSYVDGVLSLAIQIADALDHAHRREILHGDLKPSNVLLTPALRPMLLDFNLSRDLINSPDVCGGTLPYMPPEHLHRLAKHERPSCETQFDPGADIYSFGALLYELLTGVHPVELPNHSDNSADIARSQIERLRAGIAPPSSTNPFVSRRLDVAILRCLAFNRNDRPATMLEVNAELKRESRSLSAIKRVAQIRPLFFSAIVGLPITVAAIAAVYIASAPDKYLVKYQQGLRLASAGDFGEASNYFASAVDLNPSFLLAKFQLARARLLAGNVDAAIIDFDQLVQRGNDSVSTAYLGYCFNVKDLPIAAIPWHEFSISNGNTSAAVYNNLGASYIDARSRLPLKEQFRLADQYLLRAFELNKNSATIQLNLVRLAILKSELDDAYDPFTVWRHAVTILRDTPNDPLIRFYVATWYAIVVKHETADGVKALDDVSVSDSEQSLARGQFEQLSRTDRPSAFGSPPNSAEVQNRAKRTRLPNSHRFYLEPKGI